MKSVIICEGRTDLVLIQYFMEIANGWQYANSDKKLLNFKFMRNLNKNDNTLTIGEVGGCGNIQYSFHNALERNILSSDEDDMYSNIVVICDRDEANTEINFEGKLTQCLLALNIKFDFGIESNKWMQCTSINSRHNPIYFRVLPLIIPFDETGALETFLLEAISNNDIYDKGIIDEGNKFIETVDFEGRYLTRRRYKTKAKFDVYFSVRTPLEQYGQRNDILKGVPWERYEAIQSSFAKLKELG